jgi:hypothetical protein
MKKLIIVKLKQCLMILLLFAGVQLSAQDALEFDGTSDYVNIGNDASLNVGNTVTVEAWIYPANLGARVTVFSSRSENDAGSWQVEVGTGNSSSNVIAVSGPGTWVAESEDNAIILNEWNHIAFVRNGTSTTGSCTFYVNGNEVDLQAETAFTFNDNTSDKTIGVGTNLASFFNGKLDEVRVWNVARTQEQIQQNLFGELAGTETGLIAYYPMTTGSGTSVTDNSVNSNTGTFVGTPTWITGNIFPSEAGNVSDPYQISSAMNLMWLAQNSGKWGSYFEQTDDINMAAYASWNNGEGFSPIGYDDASSPVPFTGNYNGQNHFISNLSINRPSGSENQGLFGYTNTAVLLKLGVKDAAITGDDGTGALVGKANNTSITECYSSGSITGQTKAGGLAGSTNSSTIIENCYSLADVSGNTVSGGLVGEQNSSSINYSYSAGTVSGSTTIGGLVALSNSSTTENSFWDTETSTQTTSEGGIGKTSTEMKTQTTFTDSGWDFTGETTNGTNNYWAIAEFINQDYPYFSNQGLPPVVTTNAVTDINPLSATGNGNIESTGTQSVSEHGVCWNTTGTPTINNSNTTEGTAVIEAFTTAISGLTPLTTYYVRAFATNSVGTSYGETVSFTTNAHFTGSGTEADPYEISTLDDLKNLSENTEYWGYVFIQTADIDASGTASWNSNAGFSPIGTFITLQNNIPFTGVYKGNGKTISNLNINRPSTEGVGLFAYTESAVIQNLGLIDVSIIGSELVSALVGRTGETTTISNCFSTGAISSGSYYGMVGGLIGYHAGSSSISNSYSMASITGTRTGGTRSLGGLIGSTHVSAVTNCYSTGLVSGGAEYVGGLIGYSMATITNCFWDTETSGQTSSSGGATGKTTAEMHEASLYIQAGWDFMDETVNGTDNNWGINAAENSGYPFLAWQGYPNDTELSLSTQFVTDISTSTLNATANGTIYTLGSPAPTQHGVCWNTTGSPTLSDNYTEEGTPTAGSFTSEMTGLTLYAVYYVRAYATNSSGTVYGNEVSFVMTSAVPPSTGDGSSSAPYEIANLENLLWLSETQSEWAANKYFIQTADIDATVTAHLNDGAGFSPIGIYDWGNWEVSFQGNYNGQGHVIDGLYINRTENDYNALFGFLYGTATVQNLGVTNVNITGKGVAALVGAVYSGNVTISNCYSSGTVTSTSGYTGGLVAYLAYGTMEQCYSSVDVLGTSYSGAMTGRVQGGKAYNCYATGSVTQNPDYMFYSTSIGGFAGAIDASSIVNNCYSTASVGTGDYVGGFVAYFNSATVTNCFWDTETSGQSTSAAGTGKTTNEMKTAGTFLTGSWDFTLAGDIWSINGNDNNGYPFLRWQGYTPSHIWLGTSTNVWGTAGNWSENSLPTTSKNVVIPDVANAPEIAANTTADCNNLSIESGATLTIQSDATNNGSLIVSGTSAGDITYNRYLTSNDWHLVSSPVGSQSINTLVTTAGNAIATQDPKYGLAPYDNSTADWAHYTTSTIGSAGNFIAGKGYEVFRTSNGTIEFTGTVDTDDVSIGITDNTNAWNLAGNPFPSAINGNAPADANDNFLTVNTAALHDAFEAIYVWDANAGTPDYLTVNQTSGAFYIAPGQAFFVNSVSGGNNVNFTEAMQIHQTGDIFKSTTVENPTIKLIAEGAGSTTNAKIIYIDGMTTGLDPGYDAGRFSGGDNSFAVYTHLVGDDTNPVDFDIQCLPANDFAQIIPVGLNAPENTEIEFRAEALNLPADVPVYLEDKVAGSFTKLSEPGSFYTVKLSAQSQGTGRFFLHSGASTTGSNPLDNETDFTIIPRPRYNNIRVTGKVGYDSQLSVYDLAGRKLLNKKLNNTLVNDVNMEGLKSGLYVVSISSSTKQMSKKISWIKN